MSILASDDPYVAFTRRFFARWSPLYDWFAKPIGFAYSAAVRLAGAAPGRNPASTTPARHRPLASGASHRSRSGLAATADTAEWCWIHTNAVVRQPAASVSMIRPAVARSVSPRPPASAGATSPYSPASASASRCPAGTRSPRISRDSRSMPA